jgi:hypothetical protein
MLKNNKFSKDGFDERLDRVELISANIDTYSVELGLSAETIAWAQNAGKTYFDANVETDLATGGMNGGYDVLQRHVGEATKFYCTVKKLLLAIIQHNDAGPEILEAYAFEGNSPRNNKGLVPAIDTWKATHDKLVAEGNPNVVADSLVAKLVGFRDQIDAAWRVALEKKGLASEAIKTRNAIFEKDCEWLRLLYSTCKIAWGDNGAGLMMLGFVRKSEIWTEKKKVEKPVEPT